MKRYGHILFHCNYCDKTMLKFEKTRHFRTKNHKRNEKELKDKLSDELIDVSDNEE